ncbi:hypothetical protein [Burkholderia sp. F1]|uniref:hypothetical protein n=1 Tax=Burkholderia sp. F1 TaxID=3366817 RepID=UPI003D74773C
MGLGFGLRIPKIKLPRFALPEIRIPKIAGREAGGAGLNEKGIFGSAAKEQAEAMAADQMRTLAALHDPTWLPVARTLSP